MKIAFLFLLLVSYLLAENRCMSCHGSIEHIREENSGMMKAILEVAQKAGHQGNDCIVCHGGSPAETRKLDAHRGTVDYFKTNKGPKEFYPAPGSTWINQNTCGMCHEEQVASQMNSLMMTDSGKIQGALWSFGAKNGYKHDIGTNKTSNPTDPHKRLGTKKYKEYMQKLTNMEPQAFPSKMKELPAAPTAEEIMQDPSLAVYTYLRQECLRCHTASKGRQEKGEFRGVGCASCHIPYSNEGFYEGNDLSIDKSNPGHLLVHSIQSSRDAKVKVKNIEYSGIPVQTCTTCHNRGKRIGTSYQGLMEKEYNSGNYMHMQEDIHFKKGMLCQDCHTSSDMHGDGFLGGSNAAAVEAECQDCHGTTTKYPWELPLGFGDEFSTTEATGKARGVTQTMAAYLKKGSVNKPRDGYLLTARGNPLIHAVKDGDDIVMHLASGKDIKLTPLKKLKETKKLSAKGLLAMDSITAHTQNMECYTCHAAWAPQCYGCHVTIDYSEGKQNPDYLKASHDHDIYGKTGGMKDLRKYLVDGKVTETLSFIRWEDPPLVQNGEGRISPAVPGAQTTITVIGKDGETILKNHIYKIANVEGAGEEGQNAIDMVPIQPHTISKEGRECESCHTTKKAMGMGIGGLRANMDYDYSKFLDENGTQLQTVGHHWTLSGPLSKKQRDKLDRSGVCFSCHQDIPSGNLAVSALTHMADMAEINIDNTMHKTIINKSLNFTAWIQVILGLILVLLVMYGVYLKFFKKKEVNPRNEGWK